MEINERNTVSTGLPIMIDTAFLNDKSMPSYYVSLYGTRYYGKTPEELVKILRRLEPETTRSMNRWEDPWEQKRLAQAEWARRGAVNKKTTRSSTIRYAQNENDDYMNVPYLNILGLPNTMKGMKVKRRKSTTTRKENNKNGEVRHLKVTTKKSKTKKSG